MPLQQTSGNVTADAYGGGAAVVPTYIEDVFSTYLYTGNGSTQTITNGIDLAGKGGLTWIKSRSAATDHKLTDTVRGATKAVISDTTGAQTTDANGLTSFGSTGFSIGTDSVYNTNAATYASWTFRKQPKFFDVVTYTGDGTANRAISHSLGSVPGMVIVKKTSYLSTWYVYHRATGQNYYIPLNNNSNALNSTGIFGTTPFSASNFYVGSNGNVNGAGDTFVAYVFAHDAGGFGLTGTDNVISCGSFTTDGSGNATVNLGYEPQWVLVKRTDTTSNWVLMDNMRGFNLGTGTAGTKTLFPNLANAEASDPYFFPNATGFSTSGYWTSATVIYIAIRRGPMKVPTDATKVFSPSLTAGAVGSDITVGFPVDAYIGGLRPGSSHNNFVQDRLRGFPQSNVSPQNAPWLTTETIDPEYTTLFPVAYQFWNTGFKRGSQQGGLSNLLFWAFQRAPGFFDEVCYTGTGANLAVNHNLGVAPELMIVKSRSAATGWAVYSVAAGSSAYLRLDTGAYLTGQSVIWNSTTPTATQFFVGPNSLVDTSGATYVAYLFASVAGVSKVGSYTGTGSTQTIDCGFTGGARFVLIKRLSGSVIDWYVWDSARGMVSGTDPSLLLNSTAAEGYANSVYTTTGGFQIVSTATGINASGGTYIFLAIA